MLVDADLTPPGSAMTVIANTAETAADSPSSVAHSMGTRLPVKRRDGVAYVAIRGLPPSEVLVLVNRP